MFYEQILNRGHQTTTFIEKYPETTIIAHSNGTKKISWSNNEQKNFKPKQDQLQNNKMWFSRFSDGIIRSSNGVCTRINSQKPDSRIIICNLREFIKKYTFDRTIIYPFSSENKIWSFKTYPPPTENNVGITGEDFFDIVSCSSFVVCGGVFCSFLCGVPPTSLALIKIFFRTLSCKNK